MDPLAIIHGDSPEATGVYQCPGCSNRTDFFGIDAHGYPGPYECEGECGYDPDSPVGPDYCSCEVVLTQPFRIVNGEPDYDTFDGGGDGAEIGEYTTIVCGECEAIIWENDSPDDRAIGRNYGYLPGESEPIAPATIQADADGC